MSITTMRSLRRLYSKAKILGYKRGQRVTEHNVSLVKIEGVLTNKDARYYQGKRVAYVYKAKRATKNKVRHAFNAMQMGSR
jgi:ribosomal protein L35AE/L33A